MHERRKCVKRKVDENRNRFGREWVHDTPAHTSHPRMHSDATSGTLNLPTNPARRRRNLPSSLHPVMRRIGIAGTGNNPWPPAPLAASQWASSGAET